VISDDHVSNDIENVTLKTKIEVNRVVCFRFEKRAVKL
jgi:hypothetical protein